MIYTRYISDLEKVNAWELKVGDVFYRCFDFGENRHIQKCVVLRKLPYSINHSTTIIRNYQGECEIECKPMTARIKTLNDFNCYLNY